MGFVVHNFILFFSHSFCYIYDEYSVANTVFCFILLIVILYPSNIIHNNIIGAAEYELFITTETPSRYFSVGRGPLNTTPRIRKSNAIKFEIPI